MTRTASTFQEKLSMLVPYQDESHDEFPAKQLPAVDATLAEAARWKGGVPNRHCGSDEAHQDETAEDAASDLTEHVHEALYDGDVTSQQSCQGHLDVNFGRRVCLSIYLP
jgi:hypothetical protein